LPPTRPCRFPYRHALGGATEFADEAENASPIRHISKEDPALICNGDKDQVVPVEQSLAFAAALKKGGVKVKLVILRGAGHGGGEFLAPEETKTIDTFLHEHVGSRKTAQSHP
jgi:dipeptidyl aminopeptidase/acylaminoacyl peptidase